MLLPGSYLFSLILLILGLLCQGTWANTLKMTAPKWRFELYAYDFAIGVLAAALITAFTVGTLGLDGFTVKDDLTLAGKRQEMFALMAGCIFSLANILLLGATSLAGMAVAFPICFGTSLVTGVVLAYTAHRTGSPLLLAAGGAAVAAAIIFAIVAWKKYRDIKSAAAREAAAEKEAATALAAAQSAAQVRTASQGISKKPARKKSSAAKAVSLAVIGGLLMSALAPLTEMAEAGENGLGPYSALLIFAFGVLIATFVCNLFFMNLPVQGAPLEFSDYLNGDVRRHGLGILGGVLWCAGAAATLVAARAEGAAIVGPSLRSGIGQGAMVLAAAWGLIVWKEFGDAESSIKLLLGAMFVLLIVGIGVVSVASIYGAP
jgi:glucose uptake protein